MRMTRGEIDQTIEALHSLERRLIEASIFIHSDTGWEKLQRANVNLESVASLMGRKIEALESETVDG